MTSNEKPAFFPMFVDLSEKKIVVIGAGEIAKRRITTLAEFTENITVVSPTIACDIRELAGQTQIILVEKKYEREDIYGADIVIAATDDVALNSDIHSVCKCLGILVNVVSDKNKCDFYFPGIVKQENLVIGVNAGGVNHKLAKVVRTKIAELLTTIRGTRDE